MFRLLGLLAIIPAALLLTTSFFVLFVMRKLETGGLKVFGYVIVALLWIASLLVFSAGVYTVSTGRHPMMCMMQEMMKSPMHGMMKGGKMSPMMMKDKMPQMMPGEANESKMK